MTTVRAAARKYRWPTAWAVFAAWFAFREARALSDGRYGHMTLSQTIRALTRSEGSRSILVGLLAWLFWHLVIEGR